jgi:hypothetical protein
VWVKATVAGSRSLTGGMLAVSMLVWDDLRIGGHTLGVGHFGCLHDLQVSEQSDGVVGWGRQRASGMPIGRCNPGNAIEHHAALIFYKPYQACSSLAGVKDGQYSNSVERI